MCRQQHTKVMLIFGAQVSPLTRANKESSEVEYHHHFCLTCTWIKFSNHLQASSSSIIAKTSPHHVMLATQPVAQKSEWSKTLSRPVLNSSPQFLYLGFVREVNWTIENEPSNEFWHLTKTDASMTRTTCLWWYSQKNRFGTPTSKLSLIGLTRKFYCLYKRLNNTKGYRKSTMFSYR